MKKKFIVAGGGTGGHIYPGVAIARAMETLDPEIEVDFVGSSLGLETKIIPREGFNLHLLSAGKINYKGSIIGKILGVIKAFIGVLQAFILLLRLRPIGVLGVGGYASGPLVLAAAILRIPTSIWEPNAHPGLANRWLSKIVPRSFIVFEAAREFLKSSKIQLVGLPVRSELENLINIEKEEGSVFHVLGFGGSQGARAINEVLEASVVSESPWLHKAKLIHQTGVPDYQKVKEIYETSVFDVKAFEYLFEMNQYYQWADVVVCRSGASTIAELAAAGKPAILIPLPTSADDHQKKNALALVERQAAILIEQKNLTVKELNEVLLDLQNHPQKLSVLKNNIRAMHKPRGAETIARALLEI